MSIARHSRPRELEGMPITAILDRSVARFRDRKPRDFTPRAHDGFGEGPAAGPSRAVAEAPPAREQSRPRQFDGADRQARFDRDDRPGRSYGDRNYGDRQDRRDDRGGNDRGGNDWWPRSGGGSARPGSQRPGSSWRSSVFRCRPRWRSPLRWRLLHHSCRAPFRSRLRYQPGPMRLMLYQVCKAEWRQMWVLP